MKQKSMLKVVASIISSNGECKETKYFALANNAISYATDRCYCDVYFSGDNIVRTMGWIREKWISNMQEFTWNDCRVCTNPIKYKEILNPKRSWVDFFEAHVAEWKNKWFFGYSYGYPSGGGGSPVMHESWDTPFDSKYDALIRDIGDLLQRSTWHENTRKLMVRCLEKVKREKVASMLEESLKSRQGSWIEKAECYIQAEFSFPEWAPV